MERKPRSSWDDVREWVTDATRAAIREAEDLTHRGRLKMEILSLSHKIEREMAELGARFYDRVKSAPDEPVAPGADMRAIMHRITRLQEERTAKRAEYEAEKKRRKA